jgi:hypothetical protein
MSATMWRFLREHVLQAAVFVAGGAMTVWGLLSDAYQLWTAGLPPSVWAAVGAAIFFATTIVVLASFYGGRAPTPRVRAHTPPEQLERVSGKIFHNERVVVDGRAFVGCEFHNVTLEFNGDRFSMLNCKFDGFSLASSNEDIDAAWMLVHDLGLTKIPMLVEGRQVDPSNPVPEGYFNRGQSRPK